MVVRPEATREALVNPGMGFCHYAYAGRLWAYGCRNPASDTLDWFPGCSTVYLRVLWSDLEPEEGRFRWDIFDRYAQPWIATGKKIGIRVICCNQTENACPDFVRAAGAKGSWFRYGGRGASADFPERWEPVYDDPVFLAKFTNFLRAFARRYDGDPSVAFVDVGSFGIYGEGHSPNTLNKLQRDDPAEYNRLAQLHLELWRKCLPKTYLVVSDDIGGGRNPDPDHPNLAKARELGIGFRDDSIFCSESGWFHDGWARRFAVETPVVVETGHWTALGPDSPHRETRGFWKPERLVECIERYQASYFSIHDFPEPHLKRYREVLEEANLRLGYRFVLEEAAYPGRVRADTPLVIRTRWHNAGVAPCYRPQALAFSLVDGSGRVTWSVTDDAFDFRTLKPTLGGVAVPVAVETSLRFGYSRRIPAPDNCLYWARETGRDPGDWNVMLKEGVYTLCVSVGNAQGTPEIALPLRDGRGDRRYPLGTITIY